MVVVVTATPTNFPSIYVSASQPQPQPATIADPCWTFAGVVMQISRAQHEPIPRLLAVAAVRPLSPGVSHGVVRRPPPANTDYTIYRMHNVFPSCASYIVSLCTYYIIIYLYCSTSKRLRHGHWSSKKTLYILLYLHKIKEAKKKNAAGIMQNKTKHKCIFLISNIFRLFLFIHLFLFAKKI